MKSTPRFDPFGLIHKAIRLALTDLLVRIGQTSPRDERAVSSLASTTRQTLAYYATHLRSEDAWLKPGVEQRLPGGASAFDDHPEHERALEELSAQVEALADEAHRARTLKNLYLHFSVFVGNSFAHMAEEERVLLPLLHRFFDDDELRAMHANILAATSPDERALTLPLLLRALSPDERTALQVAS
jgi:hypothetical protein